MQFTRRSRLPRPPTRVSSRLSSGTQSLRTSVEGSDRGPVPCPSDSGSGTWTAIRNHHNVCLPMVIRCLSMSRRLNSQPSRPASGVSDQAATTVNGTSRVMRLGSHWADLKCSSTRFGTSLTRLLIASVMAESSMSSLTLPMGSWYVMVHRPKARPRSARVAARGGAASIGKAPPPRVGSPGTPSR